MPFNLALIRQRYNPFGGAERFIERALAALIKEGAKITLITRNWEGAAPQKEKSFAQQIINPPYSKFWGGRASRDKSFSQGVNDFLATQNFDIVQSHERIAGCSIFRAGDGVHKAWLIHRARKISAARHFFDQFSPFHQHILREEKKMLAHEALQAIICNSELVRGEFMRYYQVPESKLVVIENGVDLTEFHPNLISERERQRHVLGIPNDAPVFLFVGNGFERKGVSPLLKALARTKNKQSRLVIVGDDRRFASYEREASDLHISARVTFAGPQKDVRPFYGAADVFVLPTLYDPMPNAALEAMASGLPIITSPSCGISTRVKEGENGFISDALDHFCLARHFDALSEKGIAEKMREASRAAVADLSLENMAEKLIALYQTIGGIKIAFKND